MKFFMMFLAFAALFPGNADAKNKNSIAVFAGGCFWCMEKPFDKVEGVLSTTSGFTGGISPNPTYKQVVAGKTGHVEAMQVVYDTAIISYEELLNVFWANIDPDDNEGQFCDRGSTYAPGIFYLDEAQKAAAMESRDHVSKRLDREIVVPIREFAKFFPAEDYHQDFYKKSPIRYSTYRWRCGRDKRLEQVWGDDAVTGLTNN